MAAAAWCKNSRVTTCCCSSCAVLPNGCCAWVTGRTLVCLPVSRKGCRTGGQVQKLKGYYVLLFQLRGFAEWLLRLGNWKVFGLFTGFPQELSHWRRVLSRPGRLTAGINYYRANLQLILPRSSPRVSVPVTGIFSDGGRFLTERQMLASADYCDAGFRYLRVSGANHWLQLDAPEQVTPLILAALA